MKLYDAIIGTVEKHIAPIAAKVGNQPHVRAMRDGFIVAMPFIIVGSFILIFAFPPFAEDTTFTFGRLYAFQYVDGDHDHLRVAWCRLQFGERGGTGIFTAVMCAFFAVELYRFMKKHNITIRMPEQVPPAIARSFEVLLPVLAVFVTLYPLSIFVQTQYDMLIPDAVMAMFFGLQGFMVPRLWLAFYRQSF